MPIDITNDTQYSTTVHGLSAGEPYIFQAGDG